MRINDEDGTTSRATNASASSPGLRGPSATLVEHFRAVFLEAPQARTFRFLVDGEGAPQSLTNDQMDARVRAIAAALGDRVRPGDRALIVCPPGLDYVASFLACLYAGVIAVPVYPPDPVLLKRTLPRLLGVITDARPAVVMATRSIAAMADQIAQLAPGLGELGWLTVDDIDMDAARSWTCPSINGDTVAFLQYTSGSTGRPKGVVVSHGNLLHNLKSINDQILGYHPDNHMVTWLPPYHDMGLIGGLLSPAYGAFPTTFMSPVAFLKKPLRWLRAVSDHGATITGGPNFAYDLCVARISDEARQELDLSSLRIAFSGAEPVRAATMDRFAQLFEPRGFRRTAYYPCYGLAEATLFVTGGDRTAEPAEAKLRTAALAENRVEEAAPGEDFRSNIGCGWSIDGQDVVIADPDTCTRAPEGTVGEIWVRGPSIARGYWERPQESAEVFGARLADTGEEPYLRTGDLGFVRGGELYVAGRRKDVIIIAGRNHYPQDIERSIEASDPALRPGCGVACSYEADDEERLLIVHEIVGSPERLDRDRVVSAIRASVAEEHGLDVHDVVLVRRGGVPKTSSGKLQRSACRKAFLEGKLEAVASWSLTPATEFTRTGEAVPENVQASNAESGKAHTPDTAGTADPARRAEVEQRLIELLAARLNVTPAKVDPHRPIAAYGLRSVDMVGMVGELEQWLGRTLPSTLAWEYPTVEALADHLSATPSTTAPTASHTAAPATAPAAQARPGDTTAPEPVAIIGIGCRFPGGADGPDSFWRLLCEGRDAVTEVPADRWDAEEFLDDDPAAPGKTTTRWGGFVRDVDKFDAHFFGISAHEATRMDPQQRLLAEVAWEALEDAGLAADSLAGSPTGVFVGIATSDYGHIQLDDVTRIDAYTGTGNAFSIAANRLSYLLDLRGPSMAIDTACSSSLVAVHQACASLAQGDCSLALAGGVNLVLSPALAINFSKAGAMAPDGRCKTFDARANGYVRAEGAGVVVLKPLSRALADRDTVYGVIRGGAVNQDGRSNGIMAPNPHAQEAVLRAAYDKAGISPERVHYVEAHGTGTLLGDPIEAKALAAVVSDGRDPSAPCVVGSVKSNLGHLEAAAGIAGLIKATLMVRHREIPPSLHYETPNPHIPFAELSLRVPTALEPWPDQDAPALAGVSSFGFGGTNAHLVVEEPPRQPAPGAPADDRPHLLTVSARGAEALRDLAARYERHLGELADDTSPFTLCSAAALRRVHHEHRLAAVGRTTGELREALAAFGRGEERPGLSSGTRRVGRRPKAVFVFSGQGPRWWPVAQDLLDTEPVFRQTIERCDAALRPHTDWSLLEQLTLDQESSRLSGTAVGQPALCAVQIALAALWRSWGVEPSAVVGHSVGEIAAAQAAGALTLEDAVRVALHRGRVIRRAVGKGRMAVVGLPYDETERRLAAIDPGPVWPAASNGPNSTVLSGELPALQTVARALDADGVFCRVLESVDFASHSPQMDPLQDELRELLTGLEPRAADVPVFSTVTGRAIDGTELGADYWATNLRRPVLFDRAVTALVDSGHDAFVEISPHPMLGDAVAERISLQQADGAVAASLRRDEPGRATLLGELGRLHSAGYPVDWSAQYGALPPNTALPAYPWQRERCWLEDEYGRGRRPAHHGHPVLETHLHTATAPGAHHWTARLDLEGAPYLTDHRVAGTAVLPAALLLDAATAAAGQVLGERRAVLEEVRFTRMTVVPQTAADATFQLVLEPATADAGSFRIFSRGQETEDWAEAAHGRFRAPRPGDDDSAREALPEAQRRCDRPVDAAAYYAGLAAAGLEYGPAFQGAGSIRRGPHEAVARLRDLAELTADRAPYLVHPALLDSALQVLAAALAPEGEEAGATYLPVGVGAFTLASGATPAWAHAVAGAAAPGEPEISGARVTLFDAAGALVGEVAGITLQRLDQGPARDAVADSLLELQWQEAAPDRAGTDAGTGWWLVLADRGGTGEALRSELVSRGGACVAVTAAGAYRRLGKTEYEIDPTRPEDFAALLADLRATQPAPCAGVVHTWSLDADLPEDAAATPDGGPQAAQDIGTVSVLHLVQALVRHGAGGVPRLVLVTRGAQRLADDEAPTAVAQAATWGLARVVALEHGELRPLVVDLDPARPADEAARLADEVLRAPADGQLALRGDRRHAPRLRPWSPPAEEEATWARRPFDPERDTNHRLLATHPGILDSLTPTLWRRTPPGPGQVEIAVTAAGLNFNDVLKALGICPGVEPGIVPLGGECAGTVTAVGEGVRGYQVGDAVMAVAPSSMAAYATTTAELVAPAPKGLTDEEAAAVPIAFLTAVYGLEYLAHLGKGETVLIHSATGGVGLAALQVARRCGARVLATAGSEEKRELLRRLGVEHVMDSRSLRFADEVAEITGGRGVDVVLNSLTGEALTRSLALLAPNGRFVEIGKQDIYADSRLAMGLLRHNRSFLAVDLERSLAEQHPLIEYLFGEVLRGFADGEFTALPVTAFPYADAGSAFALMAQARHIGKVVLRPTGQEEIAVPPTGAPVREDATYLITGGLGALGLETARYLAGKGARHLVLLGRSEPSAGAARAVEELRTGGTRVEVRSCDVSRYEDVTAVLDGIEGSMPPLAGVVHAAGVLDDGLLLQLDRERFRSVAAPKAVGAWHLHRATLGHELDFFVMFSSAAALLGSPSQGNYAAANAFLDALAHHRRARGLSALSIDYGPWSEIGLAARPDRGGALDALGIESVSPRDGIEALDRLLRTPTAQASVLPLDRGRLRDAADSGLLPDLLTGLLAPTNARPAGGRPSGEVREKLLAVEPGRRRVAILAEHAKAEAARVLKLDAAKIDTSTPLAAMGFDSLMSLELRKRLEASLRIELPATVAWRFPTIDALVPFLAERMGIALEAGTASDAAGEPPAEEPETDLDQLPDSDIEALLLAKMTQIDEGR
jgi:phthiocerol/phenolphthiocerol synthesis type-I polyketide synthase C